MKTTDRDAEERRPQGAWMMRMDRLFRAIGRLFPPPLLLACGRPPSPFAPPPRPPRGRGISRLSAERHASLIRSQRAIHRGDEHKCGEARGGSTFPTEFGAKQISRGTRLWEHVRHGTNLRTLGEPACAGGLERPFLQSRRPRWACRTIPGTNRPAPVRALVETAITRTFQFRRNGIFVETAPTTPFLAPSGAASPRTTKMPALTGLICAGRAFLQRCRPSRASRASGEHCAMSQYLLAKSSSGGPASSANRKSQI